MNDILCHECGHDIDRHNSVGGCLTGWDMEGDTFCGCDLAPSDIARTRLDGESRIAAGAITEAQRVHELLTAEPTEEEVEAAWRELQRHRIGSSPRPDMTTSCDCGAIELATTEGWLRQAQHPARAILKAAREARR